jgi:5'-methylthioadenosine phosphorylase
MTHHHQHTYGIIGGSQGFRTARELAEAARGIGRVTTPYGDSSPFYRIESGHDVIFFLSRHGDNGYEVSAPFVNYRANIWAMKELGVERIVAWSGPGAIDPSIPVGDMLVPADLIDETRGRDYTFYDGLGIGFIRQNPVFCPELSASLSRAVFARQGHCRETDVYVCTQGPRLETPAEIRKFAAHGATLVGMTLIPEAFLARELEMCYCPLCYVTNYAEGVVERAYKPGTLFEGLLDADERTRVDMAVAELMPVAMDALRNASHDRDCPCGRAMERYRKRGDVGEDWRTWVSRPSN